MSGGCPDAAGIDPRPAACNASVMAGALQDDDAAGGRLPMTVGELIERGGITQLEREGAAQAVFEVRQFWLQVFEAWLDQCDGNEDLFVPAYLTGEIRRLRRLTGIPASPERRRAQVRDRVRRWRQARIENDRSSL